MSLDGTAGVTINGEHRRVAARARRSPQLIAELGLDPPRVAVERNLEIVPRSTFGEVIGRGWRRVLKSSISSAGVEAFDATPGPSPAAPSPRG